MKKLRLFLFFILILITINSVYLILSFGFLWENHKLFLYSITVVISLAILLSLRYDKNKLPYLVVFFIATVLTYFSGETIKKYQVLKSTSNAEKVINRIEQFKKINKVYPKILNDLNSDLPTSVIGVIPKQFEYENKNDYFILSFNSFRNTKVYNSKTKEWAAFD